ncbi:amidase [Methylocapsa sp. S129]|uniref:amidase n=1 Tax=Methylocapsa sp. S129 TaxID=1641869 RepID=UPI002110D18A|nr:amidase [Methylocapsa sp. S129]
MTSQSPSVDIRGRSAQQLAALMSAGLLSPEEVAEQTLAAIAACEDQAVFTRLTVERARAEARAATQRLRAGRSASALDGVPIAWKDLFDLEGVTTTAGSRVLEADAPAKMDATVVSRLTAAGMVCIGHANMTEFAYSGIGLNPHYGTPRNPHGREEARVPGGSSSGSAVAVARGLVPVAIGTDTGGSVRIPAAFNGIIGYKASSGRYPMDGVFALSPTLDTLGIFARTVEDAVVVDAAMRALVAPNVRREPLTGLRLIAPTNVVCDDCDPAVMKNFEAALARLAKAGAIVERAVMPAFDEILALSARHGTIVAAEAYAAHKARVEGPEAGRIDRRVAKRIALAQAMPMVDYIAIMQARSRLIQQTSERLSGRCLIAMPTVAHTAPPIAALEADDDLFVRMNAKTLRNTMLGNFLGWCGVSFPTGTDEFDLPTALLLSGAPDADEQLLSFSLTAEAIVREVVDSML